MLFKYCQVNVVSGQLTLRRFLNWISLSSVSCLTRSDLYMLVKLNGFYMQTEAIILKAYAPQLPPKALLHLETWYHQVYHLFFLSSLSDQIRSDQLLSRVWLFGTPWPAGRRASMSITNSRGLLKLMSIESVMPSNHLILCRPLLLCLQSRLS